MSDQSDEEASTWQHITFTTDRRLCPRRVSNRIPASERSQTDALVFAATGIDSFKYVEDFLFQFL